MRERERAREREMDRYSGRISLISVAIFGIVFKLKTFQRMAKVFEEI